MKIKENKGVTLLSLAITIVVLLIIAGVTLYNGAKTLRRAKLEELRTNMLLIEAKAKEYVEEVNHRIGPTPDESQIPAIREEIYETKAKLQKATDVIAPESIPVEECYMLTTETMVEWGLEKMTIEDNEIYLVKFDDEKATVEVYSTEGYNDNGTMKYSLTDIDQI